MSVYVQVVIQKEPGAAQKMAWFAEDIVLRIKGVVR